MYHIKNRITFTLIFFVSLFFSFFISFTSVAEAGIDPTIEIEKLTDTEIIGTFFDFTIMDTEALDDSFMLEHNESTFPDYTLNDSPDDISTVTLTETNAPGFIVEALKCYDVTVNPAPATPFEPDSVVIDNDSMPSTLMAELTIIGTTEVLCQVCNAEDIRILDVIADTGDGMGTVTSDPQGILCSTSTPDTTCTEPYAFNTAVTLTAVADGGSEFVGYSGGSCQNTNMNEIVVTMDDNRTCVATFNDIDECTEMTDDCVANSTCTNEQPGFSCECDPGYEGDAQVECTNIDACVNNPCDLNATCTDLDPPALDNTDGRTCECNAGYMGDGEPGNCDDIDECMAGTDNCDENATCTNTPGSFTCECNEGFEGDGTDGNCDPINECIEMTDNCEQVCIDTPEGFTCGCNNGFLLQPDGFSCEPADVNVTIGNEETDEDGLRVLIEVGDDITGPGMIYVNLPPEVVASCADIGAAGNCSLADSSQTASVAFEDADVICEVDNFPSAIELEICLCGEEDEGTVDAEIEVFADIAPGADFSEFVQILLEELDGCGGGDGCGTVVGSADTEAVAGNVIVSLLPLVVGFAGLFWRRRNRD